MTLNDEPPELSAVVSDYYRFIDHGNVPAALACFASNAVYRRPGYDAFTGLESIEEYYRRTRIINAGQHTIESLIEGKDEVAVRGSLIGRSRDGLALDVRFADFWRFRESLVVERNTYFDAAAV
ncbi:nuclear transport factor 2 family protein [Amycolatopsis sp. NPDC049868]|uniref:nuclear transport factor 2 family protein n=1 Tax=Amycolatopsis sp. NPDC049868 TaxID=3363934 RepID=UPI0037A775F3